MTAYAASDRYARAALDNECAELSRKTSGRNAGLNTFAFKLAQLGIPDETIEAQGISASTSNGYLAKDGLAQVRRTIRSGLEKGRLEPRGRPETHHLQSLAAGATRRDQAAQSSNENAADVLPVWTDPDEKGRPALTDIGSATVDRLPNEIRRHVYRQGGKPLGQPVRIKVKTRAGWTNFYRVRRPSDGAIGWQAKKPAGYRDVPYVGSTEERYPFDPQFVDEILFWTEGEKDADTLAALGALAFTFGGSGDVPAASTELVRGRDVVILVDNDDPGRKGATRKVAVATPVAASVRRIDFPELEVGGDVTDWLGAGGTMEALRARAVAGEAEGASRAAAAAGDVERPGEPARAGDSDLRWLNDRFCVVREGGKTRVLTFEAHRQKGHSREVATYLGFEDFRNFFLNRTIRVGEDKKVPLGHWWLKHPDRRQYDGVTFEPGAGSEVDGRLNLWRGWGVKPKRGSWPRMRRHIEEVLADGDDLAADYIIRWVAWSFQHPAERAQAALVFKGSKGTGKGTLGNALCTIFGQHGTHISSAEHLSGRFNGHLRDACLLFADEAYWPGDKGAEGSLKRLVTEPDLFIEAKGRDGITVANMLHIIMASNEDWIVPAGEDERRYAVFGVSNDHIQDEAWFRPIYAEMQAGGLAAMLHDLLAFDLGDWHPRRIPKTEGLLHQQAQSLRPEDQWWIELLQSGQLWGADPAKPNCAVSNAYEEEVPNGHGGTRMVRRKGLFDQARDVSPKLKAWSDHLLGQHLSKHGCSREKKVLRRRGWEFPPLGELRTEWEKRFPGWKWNTPELSEWQAES